MCSALDQANELSERSRRILMEALELTVEMIAKEISDDNPQS